MLPEVMLTSNFPNLNLVKKGKVRDIYDLGENYLIVSTDRLSAFDVIMNQGIPFKGAVLNKISEFWFNMVEDVIETHYISTNVNDFPQNCLEYSAQLCGRAMLVKKGNVIPMECIVRNYISGSAWVEYKKSGTINGLEIAKGLVESAKLESIIFTPSTKEEIGAHDENISLECASIKFGKDLVDSLQKKAIDIFKICSEYALSRGIIIADTKMEFAHNILGGLILVDELLTPDSSRFWETSNYLPGKAQDSFDKQFVRDYLLSINFNKQPPAPDLPIEITQRTSEKYLEAYFKLTGKNLF